MSDTETELKAIARALEMANIREEKNVLRKRYNTTVLKRLERYCQPYLSDIFANKRGDNSHRYNMGDLDAVSNIPGKDTTDYKKVSKIIKAIGLCLEYKYHFNYHIRWHILVIGQIDRLASWYSQTLKIEVDLSPFIEDENDISLFKPKEKCYCANCAENFFLYENGITKKYVKEETSN